jgi:hypothetical protein
MLNQATADYCSSGGGQTTFLGTGNEQISEIPHPIAIGKGDKKMGDANANINGIRNAMRM